MKKNNFIQNDPAFRCPIIPYNRGGQTFLIAGQIWKLFFISGSTIQNYWLKSCNFCETWKNWFFWCFFEKKPLQFSTNFVLICRPHTLLFQITERGPRTPKKVGGSQAAHGPHFGHVCPIRAGFRCPHFLDSTSPQWMLPSFPLRRFKAWRSES